MNRSLLLLCLCLCLSGCKSKESVAVESTAAVAESTTVDPFAVGEGEYVYNPDNTVAETKVDEEAKEVAEVQEQYVLSDPVTGQQVDVRDSSGYQGILQFIEETGGIEEVAKMDRELLTSYFESTYIYATKEEIDSTLETIYSTDTAKKQSLDSQVQEQSKAADGWVYTDDGWKDVYSETNGNTYYEISEDATLSYTPGAEGVGLNGY